MLEKEDPSPSPSILPLTALHPVGVVKCSLKSTPAHLSIESKVTEPMMFGKASISVEHQVFQVVANGNSALSWSSEVTNSCGEERRESTGHVAFRVELIDWSTTSCRPHHHRCVSPTASLSLCYCVLHCLLLCHPVCFHGDKSTRQVESSTSTECGTAPSVPSTCDSWQSWQVHILRQLLQCRVVKLDVPVVQIDGHQPL